MKKMIFTLATAGLAASCLVGCVLQPTTKPETDNYDALNQMLGASYSQLEITVTDTFDDLLTLRSVYTVSYSDDGITVDYSVERLAEISLDDPSAEFITTYTGRAVIVDGEISGDGEEIGLTAGIASPALTFKKEYFKNADLTGMYLRADVKDPSAFLGTEITCTDMKVDAFFFEVFDTITVSYTAENGNTVEYTYDFTR